jgi:hypothetical protein
MNIEDDLDPRSPYGLEMPESSNLSKVVVSDTCAFAFADLNESTRLVVGVSGDDFEFLHGHGVAVDKGVVTPTLSRY